MRLIDADAFMAELKKLSADGGTKTERELFNWIINGVVGEELKCMPTYTGYSWVPVKEKMPEESGSYLVCTKNKGAFIAHYYAETGNFSSSNRNKSIIAWMPRPETYKEVK